MEISPALWLAIKNTERGLTGPGPQGILRLEARLAPDAQPSDLDDFLAGRGGSRSGKAASGKVALELPAMHVPELCLHPAVVRLEPAGFDSNKPGTYKAPRYLAAVALLALLALTAWLGLDQYQKSTPQNPSSAGQKQQPAQPGTPKVEPAKPLPGEGPIALASRSRKAQATAEKAARAEKTAAPKESPAAPALSAKAPAKAEAAKAKPAGGKAKTALAEEAVQKAMEAMWEGNAPKAVSLLRKALQKAPDHLGLRTNLGLALMELGRLDEAEVQFREVLRRKPGDQEALSALQLIKQAQKD